LIKTRESSVSEKPSIGNDEGKKTRNTPRVNGAVKNGKWFEALYPVALDMRKEQTNAEGILWFELQTGKTGFKFRRQHVIDCFIVDFYCVKLGLVIEVDGDIHRYQKTHDEEREQRLKALGCTILRFANADIEYDLPSVLKKIYETLQSLSHER
jgi:isobutyryl-CoA mutase